MKNKNTSGNVLIGVLVIGVAMAVMVGSVASIITTQRRLDLKKELQLQANNAVETAIDYAYSYIINDVNTNTIYGAASVPTTGYYTFPFTTSATNFLTGAVTTPTGYSGRTTGITLTNMEVRCLPAEGLDDAAFFVDGTKYPSDPNKNQYVKQITVPVVGTIKATQGSQSYTAYVRKSICVRYVSLFQYSIFFQGQLHLHRGYHPMGAVHANGNLFLNAHSGDGARYDGCVSSAGRIYRGSTFDQGGSGSDPFGYVAVNTDGDAVSNTTISPNVTLTPSVTGTGGDLKILVSGTTSTYANLDNLDSTTSTWKEDALSLFKGNLVDKSHDVATMTPVGSKGYKQDTASTTTVNEFANGPYGILEPNLPTTHTNHQASLTNNLEAKATLLFIIECIDPKATKDAESAGTLPTAGTERSTATTSAVTSGLTLHLAAADTSTGAKAGQVVKFISSGTANLATSSTAGNRYIGDGLADIDLSKYSDPWRMFVVKAYKVSSSWNRSLNTDIHDYLTPVTLPDSVYHIIGRADSSDSIANNAKYDGTTASATNATKNLHGILATGGHDFFMEDFEVALSGFTLSSTTSTTGTTITAGIPFGSSASTSFKLQSSMVNPIITLQSSDISTINSSSSLIVRVNKGLFDPRLGRGVSPLTIDVDALKKIMEAPLSTLTGTDLKFRQEFDPTASSTVSGVTVSQWNGLIYIEFPTLLELQSNTAATSGVLTGVINNKNGICSRRFKYGTAELLHPDRWDVTDNYSRANRTDGIVPIAPALRRYPPSASAAKNSTILDAQYAIPAVQIINGGKLPHPNSSTDTEGFSIATNVPIYLVGNYNSDGDLSTGANLSGTTVATAETGEITAALFCDSLTILSNGWGEQISSGPSNRANSFYGANSASTNASGGSFGTVGSPPGRPIQKRKVDSLTRYSSGAYANALYSASPGAYVEISACVATGEYPIFEFFTHALETFSSATYPIVIKGSMVGMFHSEIQHIKQAYGRTTTTDIQAYYTQHGAYAFPHVRYHNFLKSGMQPPGTPEACVTRPAGFRLLRWGVTEDTTILTGAGFTAP